MTETRYLKPGEVIRRTGIGRHTLRVWRDQAYIKPVETSAKSGLRPAYVYPQGEVRKIERMAQLVEEGYSARRASEIVDKELFSGRGKLRSKTVQEMVIPRLRDCVDGTELARLFEALCLRREITPVKVNDTLREWLGGQPDSEWSGAKDIMEKHRHSTEILLLEVFKNRKVDFIQFRKLAETFKIHVLLLDPLFSHAVRGDGVVLSMNRDFVPVGDSRDKRYGQGVQYKIPWRRLATSDAVITLLELPPRTKSDVHSHIGDEFLFVLKGEVVITFEDTEVSTRVGQGDFIQYYAEQTHSASNPTDDSAELFIIRFYQLRTEGTRQGIKKAVDEAVSRSRSLPERQEVSASLLPWLRAMSSTPLPIGGEHPETAPARKEQPEFMQDKSGLGRFLEEVRVMRFGASYSEVCRTSGESEQFHRRLEKGIEEVPRKKLPSFAAAYDVREMLLHNFLYPAFPHVVVVRGLTSPLIGDDLASIDDQATGSPNVQYWVPRRNLMYSDMSIALVTLKPNHAMPSSEQPGFEFLMALEGQCKVVFENSGKELRASAEEREYVHYSGAQPHRVVTEGEPARVLLIRFHRDRRADEDGADWGDVRPKVIDPS